jgi:hypothetical protein
MISDLAGLPREVVSVHHEWGLWTARQPPHDVYYLQSSIFFMAANALKIGIWALLAIWFYQCGPRVQAFFTTDGHTEAPDTSPQSSGQS